MTRIPMAPEPHEEAGDALEEVRAIREDFDVEMRGLKRAQRVAVEKAAKAVDRKKIAKIKKTLLGFE